LIQKSLACFVACSLLVPVVAQDSVPVSEAEVIVSHIDEEVTRAVALLEKSVNNNSGSMNFEGVRSVGDLLVPEFEALVFTNHCEPQCAYAFDS